jgi:hypothetical protein
VRLLRRAYERDFSSLNLEKKVRAVHEANPMKSFIIIKRGLVSHADGNAAA